jgi:hypothetical protein
MFKRVTLYKKELYYYETLTDDIKTPSVSPRIQRLARINALFMLLGAAVMIANNYYQIPVGCIIVGIAGLILLAYVALADWMFIKSRIIKPTSDYMKAIKNDENCIVLFMMARSRLLWYMLWYLGMLILGGMNL